MKEVTAHTGLRGIAALVVMFYHIRLDCFFPGYHEVVWPFLFGDQAVDLFFVLSGFILCYVYAVPGERVPRGGFWSFHVARFARIYPLHFATLIGLGALGLALSCLGRIRGEYSLVDLVRQGLLVQAYPIIGGGRTWNPPSWSISIEYLAYLAVFPLFLRWRPARLSAGVALGAIAGLLFAELTYIFSTYHWNSVQNHLWIDVTRGVVGFLVGCLLHQLFTFHPRCTAAFQRCAPVFAGLTLAILVAAGLGWFSQRWLLVAWPPLVLALTSSEGVLGRWLSTPVAVFFGNISYSVYMLHGAAGKFLGAPAYRTGWPWKAEGIAYALAIIAASWLSFQCFEMPARVWLRTRLSGNTRPPIPA